MEKIIYPRTFRDDFHNGEMKKGKVLIVGSGKTATRIRDWDLTGWCLVTINHAYQIRDDWDIAGYAGDFPKGKQPQAKMYNGKQQHTFSHYASSCISPHECLDKEHHRNYSNALKFFGKTHGTMFFNTSYWVLVYLRPHTIGYIGCDMNYDAVDGNKTHFYGQGVDMEKRNEPDPFKWLRTKYSKLERDEALKLHFGELQTNFEQHGVQHVYNFSEEESLLPFEKKTWPL